MINSIYANMMIMVSFSDWIYDKFSQWEKQSGKRRRSIAEYARFLGVKQPTLARWVMGDSVPRGENIQVLAEKLGSEVYEILGAKPPKGFLYDLPESFRDRLQQAAAEAREILVEKGLDPESAEAEKVTIEVFSRHGFKYTFTETVQDDESG